MVTEKLQSIELSKDDFVLLGDSLALLKASADRSIKAHANDPVIQHAFVSKQQRVVALVNKIQNRLLEI